MTWRSPLKCMRVTCDSHTNLIPELLIFMIPIPTPIPLGLIPILIPIPKKTKIHATKSTSNSSVCQNTWFRFWFRFQQHVIPIPIPIQTNKALIPIKISESYTIWFTCMNYAINSFATCCTKECWINFPPSDKLYFGYVKLEQLCSCCCYVIMSICLF